MKTHRCIKSLSAALALLISVSVQAQTTSAFIAFNPVKINDNGGAALQRATLSYQDQTYQVSITGLGVGGPKGTTVTVSGEVYDLPTVEDLPGILVSELADAPPKEVSTDDLWLYSERGLSLRLHTDNSAVKLASGSDFILVQLGWDDFGWEEEVESLETVETTGE